jgi:ribosomal protein S18 acetylase RimI-like enzyme
MTSRFETIQAMERRRHSLTVRIRAGRAADVPTVRDIVERAYGVYVERIGRRLVLMDHDYAEKVREGHLFVADDDAVIGLIVLIRQRDHVLIENIAVDPPWQGTGVGRALLDYAEADTRRQQLHVLRLYTNAAMTENLILYHSLGYREDDRRGEGGFERVFLSKHLDSHRER